MRYQLTKVGAKQFSGIVEADTKYALLQEIKKHCASSYLELFWSDAETAIVLAGYHKVGEVKLISGEEEMAKSKSPKKEAKKPKSKKKGAKKSKKDSADDETSTPVDPAPPVEDTGSGGGESFDSGNTEPTIVNEPLPPEGEPKI